MSDLKQPTLKADGLMRNVTGAASPATTAATERKPGKKKSAAPVKKKVARKKVAATAKVSSPGNKAARASTLPEPAANTAAQVPAAPAPSSARPALSGDERQRMISEAAYLISLKRHAGANGPEADWLFAETVIDMVFGRTD